MPAPHRDAAAAAGLAVADAAVHRAGLAPLRTDPATAVRLTRRRPRKDERPGLAGTEALRMQGKADGGDFAAPTMAEAIGIVVADVAELVSRLAQGSAA